MIKIELQGDDALAYMRNEALKDSQITALHEEINLLTEEIQRLRGQQEPINTVSQRVKDDSEKVKEFPKKPSFAKPEKSVIDTPIYDTGSYSYENTKLIHDAMMKSPQNQDRSLRVIAAKLNRKETSVREKLNREGICVKNGMCYYKD